VGTCVSCMETYDTSVRKLGVFYSFSFYLCFHCPVIFPVHCTYESAQLSLEDTSDGRMMAGRGNLVGKCGLYSTVRPSMPFLEWGKGEDPVVLKLRSLGTEVQCMTS
jgi:hypothetical protein